MVVVRKDFGKFERLSFNDIYEEMENQPDSIETNSLGFVAGGGEVEFLGKDSYWYRIGCYDIERIYD